MADEGLYAALVARGMSRRAFLRFSAAMAAALALPASYAPRIARAVESAPRLPVIWLRGQACGGNTQALLRATEPTVANLLLEVLAVDYHEGLMTAVGADAGLARTDAMAATAGRYIAVVEGSVPRSPSACLVGGRPFADVAREVCDGALATVALGSCAFDGGAPGANGGPTDAEGIRSVSGRSEVVALPGCPANGENLAALIVHHLAFGELPPRDLAGRPLFAYGDLIHNQCERRPHFEFGEFALSWGDEGAQKGWCLYKLGCKGPETMANCPTVRYGGGVSWAIRAGHGCVGCTMPNFWDAYEPAYRRLGSPVPFLPSLTVDQVGLLAVGGIVGVAGAHGTGMAGRSVYRRRQAAKAATATEAAEAGARTAVNDGMPPAGNVGDADVPAEAASDAVTPGMDPADGPEAG